MSEQELSRRERQILHAIYAAGELSAAEGWKKIPDPPSKTAVRTLLGILEKKGHLDHRKQGREFGYFPLRAREDAGQSALAGVLNTFFDGSLEKLVASHFSGPDGSTDEDELKRLAKLIRDARNQSRSP